MIDFVLLQSIVKELLEHDRAIHTIDTSGPTLEAAVAEAATILGVPVSRIEYEIVERGFPGFMGTGKKDWKIQAYERIRIKKKKKGKEEEEAEATEVIPIIMDADGGAFVQFRREGVFLKVSPQKGNGRRASIDMAMSALRSRGVIDANENAVRAMVQEAAGEYMKVADFEHRPMNDASISIEISDAEMKCSIQVAPPGLGGGDHSLESYIEYLKDHGVVFGVKEDFLREFADSPVYREKVEVAEGAKPIDGNDARIVYKFETDQTKVKLREGSDGRVNFKELNIIQNVVQNQILAEKIPAETGIAGHTVMGKLLPAKNGRDIAMPIGDHVRVGDDGLTILAEINGQVVVANSKINVEPVYTIAGDVNLKTGNIIFLGTVVINGSVEDGFSVKAAGNIEVSGTVSKAELDAEGDIIVNQGINGKSGGQIRAGRSLWARFIENAKVEAGNMVYVTDGIINSQVDALNRIICNGKRANIMGGRLRASEEINAKVLGNPTSGTETICEVGYDPKNKEELAQLIIAKEQAVKQLDELKLNLQTLINIKKQRKTLPEDKEANLKELMDRRQVLMIDIQNAEEGIKKKQEYFNGIKTRGRVSASTKVYPGVKIIIRDIREDVRTEYRAVTFVLENDLVRVTKYEEPDEASTKGPDGYTTN